MTTSRINILLFILLLVSDMYASIIDIDGISYQITNESEVKVIRNNKYTGDIYIPSNINHDGLSYRVTESDDTRSGTSNSDNENGNDSDPSGNYLTFEAIDSGTFKFSGTTRYQTTNSLSYSLDGGETWIALASNTNSPTVSAGSKIMWKGTARTRGAAGIGSFSSTSKFNIEGNVMSILFGDDYGDKTSLNVTNNASTFRNLFSGCTNLVSAENLILPATELTESCYRGMFSRCTSLTTIPSNLLPATTLTGYCYEYMFEDCTCLTSAPTLPATTLAVLCYGYMFSGCSSLIAVPSLPATTLADACYETMFYGCKSLTTVPSNLLPATTLTVYCYKNMFHGCTSLTTAPELPATTLTSNCYGSMFYGCSSLNYIKCLATDIGALQCTTDWVKGVASSGTFIRDSAMWWIDGTNGIPNGWTKSPTSSPTSYADQYFTVITYKPTYISFKAHYSCSLYYSLDSGSTWSALPIDNFTHYSEEMKVASGKKVMFKGSFGTTHYTGEGYGIGVFYLCTNIDNMGVGLEGNIMSLLYGSSFAGKTTFPDAQKTFERLFEYSDIETAENLILPATTLIERCYYKLFEKQNITKAPELPAQTLVEECYSQMFSGCHNLNYIKCSAINGISSNNSTQAWVYDVASSGTFVKNSSTDWKTGVNGIPSGWTVQNKPDTITYTLTITAAGDGYVSYNDVSVENDTKTVSIEEGLTAIVKFHPGEGYQIKSATMNGRQIADLSSMSFTIDSMDEDVMITVEYEPTSSDNAPSGNYSYTLTITAAGDGYVSYNDISVENDTQSVSIEEGVTAVVKFHPGEGYQIKSATMNGRQIADLSSMSFTIDIMDEDVTIAVEYEPIPSASDASGNYLTFVALEGGCFSFNSNSTPISYSLDSGNTWSTLNSDVNSPMVSTGQKIMWKATLTPNTTNPYGIGTFNSTGRFNVEGNVMSLLYGDNFEGKTSLAGKNYAFVALFENNTKLVSAEGLVLPATTLARYCYYCMFYGCTSLTKAPELPATTLPDGCYHIMFSFCTSLTTAPELPATTLGNDCYASMFDNCTSLTIAPSTLPATTLANGCYYGMFYGCSGLTTAPELPATTLADGCYQQMFAGCTSLNYIKCLATNISASNCTNNWVNGVASSGTFIKASSASWAKGNDGIPLGWTVQDWTVQNETTPENENGNNDEESDSDASGILVNDLYYELNWDNTASVVSSAKKYKGDIIIPSEFFYNGKTYSVTSIGVHAFSNCNTLNSVTIPTSVTSIKLAAFAQSSLTSITIPNSVIEIGSMAFLDCSDLTSVIIGNSVRTIGSCAFENCTSLTTLVFPNSVTEIYHYAFNGCSNLKSIVFGSGLTFISSNNFYTCPSLESVYYDSKKFESEDFERCKNLKEVILGENVEEVFISNRLIKIRCQSILPPKLTWTKLDNNNYIDILETPYGHSVMYAKDENWNKIPIIYSVNNNIQYYPIPINSFGGNVVSVNGNTDGYEATVGETLDVKTCSTLSNNPLIMLNTQNISHILSDNGRYPFVVSEHHSNNTIYSFDFPLTTISLSNSGTLIDKVNLDEILNIENLKITGNINGTDMLVIRKMENLKLLDLGDAHIVDGGMSYFNNFVTSKNKIGQEFFSNNRELYTVILPQDITEICKHSFFGLSNLRTLLIPKSVKYMNSSIFPWCDNLTSIHIEDMAAYCSIKFYSLLWSNHKRDMYLKDKKIVDLVIPEGVKAISDYAFYYMNGLNSLTIPSTVTRIGKYAFQYCIIEKSITCLNPTPPEISPSSFGTPPEGLPQTINWDKVILYVPKGSKTLYWLHPYWEYFKNIVEIDGTDMNGIKKTLPETNEGIYTINGVKISDTDDRDCLPKGIYIINGKKVIKQ